MFRRIVFTLLFVLTFLLVSPLLSLSEQGLDLLALPKIDSNIVIPELPKNTVIGALHGTFGPLLTPYEKYLKSENVTAGRAHLFNGACWRNKNCERGEPKLNNFETLAYRARVTGQLFSKYPNVKCYLSPVLEYDERDRRVVQRWVDILRKNASNCTVVLSPNKGILVPGTLVERHGNAYGKADVRSNDGESLFDAPGDYATRGTVLSLGWIHSFNLRRRAETGFTPPSKRTVRPTSDEVRRAINIMFSGGGSVPGTPDPPSVSGCEKKFNPRDGKGNFTWKSGDNTHKATWLAPARYQKVFKRVDILSPNGKIFDSLRYRHQFSEWGKPYRGIYDGRFALTKYPLNSTLRADKNCWLMPDPRGRID